MKFNHIFLSVALSAALMGSFTSCDDFLAEDPRFRRSRPSR